MADICRSEKRAKVTPDWSVHVPDLQSEAAEKNDGVLRGCWCRGAVARQRPRVSDENESLQVARGLSERQWSE